MRVQLEGNRRREEIGVQSRQIRKRQELKNVLGYRAEPFRADDIRASIARNRYPARAVRIPCSRIVDHRAGKQSAEVSGPECRCRHRNDRRCATESLSLALVVSKEEGPVLDDRAAEGTAKLILDRVRHRNVTFRVAGQIEKVARFEGAAIEEFEGAA